MKSLQSGYKALVFGANGGIGSAVADLLGADERCKAVIRLSRAQGDGFDLTKEATIEAAAADVHAQVGELDFIFDATGALVIDDALPEKSLKALDPMAMANQFAVNAIGTALLFKHFYRLLPREGRSVFASISARVGSIGDNRLGGWYSYRAAKAAQNQIIKSASIEIARTRPDAVVAALHPGTVETQLSEPFAGDRDRLKPNASAERMLRVLDGLTPAESGGFFAYDGTRIEW